MEDCIFCKIIRKEISSEKIWEDENFYAFLDINPVRKGHTLLIPKQHQDYIFDIEEPLYSGLFRAAKSLSGPLRGATGAKRVGIVVEGLLVPHAHVHLVPIENPGELDSSNAKKADPEELAEIAEKIRALL
ncbi:HIT domain-containing protein [Candidatus Micrarchaeota archaeon]|nr:HIT domain-containing protein [Candidatus Micrarchaeota archaeon]